MALAARGVPRPRHLPASPIACQCDQPPSRKRYGQRNGEEGDLTGGEIADTRFRIRRRVHADDPADLGPPLSYNVRALAADDDDLDPAAAALSKSASGPERSACRRGAADGQAAGDRPAQGGCPLRPRIIQTAVGELEAAGLAAGSEEGNGRARYRSPAIAKPDADSAGDGQPGDGGGECMA